VIEFSDFEVELANMNKESCPLFRFLCKITAKIAIICIVSTASSPAWAGLRIFYRLLVVLYIHQLLILEIIFF